MGVTVQFSDDVNTALGAKAAKERERIEKEINKGLEELGKTDAQAKDLLDSEQKLRIVCFGEKEANDAGLKKPDGGIMAGVAGQGATAGDYDGDKPKKKGAAIVAIDCDLLKTYGWSGEIKFPGDTKSSMFEVLVHELLHAANKKRKHPPDDLDVYDEWVKSFLKALKKAGGGAGGAKEGDGTDKKKPKKKRRKKSSPRRARRSSGRSRRRPRS